MARHIPIATPRLAFGSTAVASWPVRLMQPCAVMTSPVCPLCKKGVGLPREITTSEDGRAIAITVTRICDSCGHEWKVEGERPRSPDLKPN
jgi:hypothetical protein